jgi:hypothetical protein
VKECTTELKTVAVKYERERGREGGRERIEGANHRIRNTSPHEEGGSRP